jgi:hypothetical protein
MPELGDGARVRVLVPAPRQPKQLPARREQRRAPPEPPAAPVPRSDGTDDRPHIDEYV